MMKEFYQFTNSSRASLLEHVKDEFFATSCLNTVQAITGWTMLPELFFFGSKSVTVGYDSKENAFRLICFTAPKVPFFKCSMILEGFLEQFDDYKDSLRREVNDRSVRPNSELTRFIAVTERFEKSNIAFYQQYPAIEHWVLDAYGENVVSLNRHNVNGPYRCMSGVITAKTTILKELLDGLPPCKGDETLQIMQTPQQLVIQKGVTLKNALSSASYGFVMDSPSENIGKVIVKRQSLKKWLSNKPEDSDCRLVHNKDNLLAYVSTANGFEYLDTCGISDLPIESPIKNSVLFPIEELKKCFSTVLPGIQSEGDRCLRLQVAANIKQVGFIATYFDGNGVFRLKRILASSNPHNHVNFELSVPTSCIALLVDAWKDQTGNVVISNCVDSGGVISWDNLRLRLPFYEYQEPGLCRVLDSIVNATTRTIVRLDDLLHAIKIASIAWNEEEIHSIELVRVGDILQVRVYASESDEYGLYNIPAVFTDDDIQEQPNFKIDSIQILKTLQEVKSDKVEIVGTPCSSDIPILIRPRQSMDWFYVLRPL